MNTLHSTPAILFVVEQVTVEDGEDKMLPAMVDDNYSTQISFRSRSKDNPKCVPDFLYLDVPSV